MVTRLPEIVVILGVIVLGLRFTRSGDQPLGYLLLGVGVIAGIWWIHSHYIKKARAPRRVGKFRVELTWATAAVLVTFVIFPWLPQPHDPGHESAQTVASPAPQVETSAAPSPARKIANPVPQSTRAATAVPSAPTIQTPAGTSSGTENTLASMPGPPSKNTGNAMARPTETTIAGPDQIPITLNYSQNGNTVTVRTSGRLDSTSLAFYFDVDVALTSQSIGACTGCGTGRIQDAAGVPDSKTIWIFWASPPFIPDNPLSVTFSSAAPAKLLKVTMGPRPR